MFYTEAELGPHQSLTPEGFLICRDVPIARTGLQIYHESELPNVAGNGDGLVAVDRPASEVFRPESIASLQGKPITINHPFNAVDPDNWSQHAVGHVANVRRGNPPDNDKLIADLVITHRRGIDAVRGGLRGVSVGYNANYDTVQPGMARQRDIVANHVSLVREARCGAACMIGDSASVRREKMSRPRKLIRDQDSEGAQSTPGVTSEPISGPKRIMQLPGPATAYQILTDGSGEVWLVQSANVEGIGDPGKLGIPPRAPAATGDKTLDRARRTQAQRDQGAAWAAKQNDAARAHWGR